MNNPRTVAFFDFDGTLSRIRSGWQTVMADHMLEVLLGTAVAAAAHPALSERVADAIEALSGRLTILQMEWLVAEVERRGGRALPAAEYKAQFADRIGKRVDARVQALQSGSQHNRFGSGYYGQRQYRAPAGRGGRVPGINLWFRLGAVETCGMP